MYTNNVNSNTFTTVFEESCHSIGIKYQPSASTNLRIVGGNGSVSHAKKIKGQHISKSKLRSAHKLYEFLKLKNPKNWHKVFQIYQYEKLKTEF